MKFLAAAIVTVALIACDFAATYFHFSKAQQSGWDWSATIGIIGFAALCLANHPAHVRAAAAQTPHQADITGHDEPAKTI